MPQQSIMSTIVNLIFFLSPSIPVLIFYRILFKNEPLAPKKHFRKYKNLVYLCAFIIIATPILWNVLYIVAMASGKIRMRKDVPSMDPSYIKLMGTPILILFAWSIIEPFVLCKKMRNIKNHYATLAKKAENTPVKQEQTLVESCCSEGSCCSKMDI
ncbi:hypothetical protein C834K_0439 [Chlamydia poikilotherma]|uniref:Uncharacterized protein n=1 Tax=Chlamydia poikilotherma TaxID=1967783 RepID=A0A3B0PRV1_9CHLA|nr:hypothetical protein [Chlamydia poikilotherma]SYX08898.1 hypothetical protein C834K_0439 [Chlamydia poikilotherma]